MYSTSSLVSSTGHQSMVVAKRDMKWMKQFRMNSSIDARREEPGTRCL